MKELSLNILDISMNSVKARAGTVSVTLTETDETLEIKIADNGCGMKKELLESVTDPLPPPAPHARSDSAFRFLRWRRSRQAVFLR